MLVFFEKVFKKERDQLTCELKPLISIVVLVIKLRGVIDSINNSSDHQGHVPKLRHVFHASWPHMVLSQGNM